MAKAPWYRILSNALSVQESARTVGLGFWGIYLALLFFIAIYLVVASLSAYQIQHRVRAVAVDGRPVSIAILREAADKLHEKEGKIGNILDELKGLSRELAEKKEVEDQADIALKRAKTALGNALGRAEARGHLQMGRSTGCGERPAISDQITCYKRLLNTAAQQDQAIQKVLADIDSADEKFEAAELSYREAKTASDRIRAKRTPKHAELQSVAKGEEVNKFFANAFGESISQDELLRLQHIAGEINSLRNVAFTTIYRFVTLQPEILTLIVVMVMGALGGLIHLTQGFLSETEQPSTAYFIFRPVLGTVTALAIYILAKAGVLVIAESGAAGGQGATLSPFFISFLAIISGLMANNAIDNIRRAGENFLRPVDPTGRQRWAIRVKAAMQEAGNKKAVDLLPFLDRPKGKIEDWIEGREPVPVNAQNVMSAWLGKPARELFTDIEPPEKPRQ